MQFSGTCVCVCLSVCAFVSTHTTPHIYHTPATHPLAHRTRTCHVTHTQLLQHSSINAGTDVTICRQSSVAPSLLPAVTFHAARASARHLTHLNSSTLHTRARTPLTPTPPTARSCDRRRSTHRHTTCHTTPLPQHNRPHDANDRDPRTLHPTLSSDPI
jgi:hypothetical protein